MKLKRQPEDFRVEELPLVEGGDFGRFGFYRLTKRGIGTLEAIEAIRRRWNLSGRQISYGGLKDRHAVTIQYLTILDGPDRGLKEGSLDLEPVGRLTHPYGPNQFRGNRFTVVLRDLSPEKARTAEQALEELPRDGLPNYFDDQRFGSVGYDGDFIGRAWLVGDHEKASVRRRRPSAKAGGTGPRPSPGSPGRTPGASLPTSSITRPTSEAPSPGFGASSGRSISPRSRVTSGTSSWPA
jgi:tRNA pseudouridine13 synthase